MFYQNNNNYDSHDYDSTDNNYDSHDYDGDHNVSQSVPLQTWGSPRMAFAAAVVGILAVLASSMIYLAFPLGALAILFALLSRGNGRILPRAMMGLIAGGAAMLLSILITGWSFWQLSSNPELKERLDTILRTWQGVYSLTDPTDLITDQTGLATDQSGLSADQSGLPTNQSSLSADQENRKAHTDDSLSDPSATGGDFI